MAYLEYIITIVAVVLAGVFAVLAKAWAGFAYFVLAILMLLAFFWAGWLMFKYFTDFKKELGERYKIYKAEKINSLQMTSAQYAENEVAFQKDFKKKTTKDRIVKWLVILFCLAVGLAFLVGMIFYK